MALGRGELCLGCECWEDASYRVAVLLSCSDLVVGHQEGVDADVVHCKVGEFRAILEKRGYVKVAVVH